MTYRAPPTRVSIPSDSLPRRRGLRIAGFDGAGEPCSGDAAGRRIPGVYLRADAGEQECLRLCWRVQAALFAGGEYLGSTEVGEVPAGGELRGLVRHRSIDQRCAARCSAGRPSEPGCSAEGGRPRSSYRIDLANLAAQSGLGRGLGSSAGESGRRHRRPQWWTSRPRWRGIRTYLDTAAVRGLLKWDGRPRGRRAPRGRRQSIKWSVRE